MRSAHYKKVTRINEETDHFSEDILPEEDVRYITEVKNNFKHLGDNCREILKRFYYQKESMREIAENFNWTEATAKNNKYIMMNAPNHQLENICRVLPGMKSPTIVPLAESGWSSVQSVVKENEFWAVIEKLKSLEAEGILVVPIEKMIL